MIRTYVKITVDLEPGWRVGSWAATASDVRGTVRDPLDPSLAWAPGSSVTGSLRQAAGDRAGQLFGCLPSNTEQPQAVPSSWWVLGTTLSTGKDSRPAIRSRKQTAISRDRRAPTEHGLSESEEVDAAQLGIYLRSDDADVTELLDVVRGWVPRLGGGRTTGRGFGTVTGFAYRRLDLDRREDLLELLTAGGDPASRVDRLLRQATTETVPAAEQRLVLRATVTSPQVGLLSEDETEYATHGSQWKGMLRSRVELIARSLGHSPCITEQSWTGCGTCDLCAAFGSTTRSGAWEFHTSRWEDGSTVSRGRNAIDRFTGGVRNQLLFTEHNRQDVTMTLRITSSRDDVPGWVHTALLHALRDLNDGLWGIGPRTSTGLGTVQVNCLTTAQGKVDLNRLEPVTVPTKEQP